MASSNDPLTDFWTAGEPPEGISAALWIAVKSIKADTALTKDKLDFLEERTAALEEKHESHDEEIAELRNHVQFLEAQMTRSNISQTQMSDSIEDLKARSMRDNIIFTFDPAESNYHEAKDENCPALVIAFLKRVLGIKDHIYIQSAHRLVKGCPW